MNEISDKNNEFLMGFVDIELEKNVAGEGFKSARRRDTRKSLQYAREPLRARSVWRTKARIRLPGSGSHDLEATIWKPGLGSQHLVLVLNIWIW